MIKDITKFFKIFKEDFIASLDIWNRNMETFIEKDRLCKELTKIRKLKKQWKKMGYLAPILQTDYLIKLDVREDIILDKLKELYLK